jgi:hypothetical protein
MEVFKMSLKYGYDSFYPHLVEYCNTDKEDKVVLYSARQGYATNNVAPGEIWRERVGEEFLGVYDSAELANKAAVIMRKREMNINQAVLAKMSASRKMGM